MLEKIPLFSCLDEQSLDYLRNAATKKTYPKNTILFSKGDESDALYLIVKGKVRTVIMDEEGREMTLNIHGAGEYIGEVALLDGRPRSATIITKEPTQVMIIYRKDFMHVVSGNMEILHDVIQLISSRLRELTDKFESLAFQDVYGRVTGFLLQMSREEDGKRMITEKLTHHEISTMVGSSREMVSKILKELSNGGYISIDKKKITILKKFPIIF